MSQNISAILLIKEQNDFLYELFHAVLFYFFIIWTLMTLTQSKSLSARHQQLNADRPAVLPSPTVASQFQFPYYSL